MATERIHKLEEELMHQQQLLQDLNQVVIELRDQVDTLQATCTQLAEKVAAPSIIDDREEKPPHY
ncbi:MAG: SlyX family protein [Planctomycetota bacterium]